LDAVHVAFTPGEAAPAAVGVVVDVLRATSTIAQALASGYERVLCCAEIDEARALRAELPTRRRRRAEGGARRGVRRRRVAARVSRAARAR
jgi:phosphosulfolactate phosphohydrolase-like enzyme